MFGGNRIIGLVFTLVLLTSIWTINVSASNVRINISPQVLSAGDTFIVDVFVEPEVAIAGMQFDLEFDDTHVHVYDVTEGDLFTQSGLGTFFNSGLVEPGLLKNVYGTILGPSNISTPAAFATITMFVEAQDASISMVNLKNVIISDPNGHPVEVEITNATIEIMDIYDVNGDWVVNELDYEIVEQHFSETTSYPYPSWDINSDGIVNILDLNLVIFNQY